MTVDFLPLLHGLVATVHRATGVDPRAGGYTIWVGRDVFQSMPTTLMGIPVRLDYDLQPRGVFLMRDRDRPAP